MCLDMLKSFLNTLVKDFDSSLPPDMRHIISELNNTKLVSYDVLGMSPSEVRDSAAMALDWVEDHPNCPRLAGADRKVSSVIDRLGLVNLRDEVVAELQRVKASTYWSLLEAVFGNTNRWAVMINDAATATYGDRVEEFFASCDLLFTRHGRAQWHDSQAGRIVVAFPSIVRRCLGASAPDCLSRLTEQLTADVAYALFIRTHKKVRGTQYTDSVATQYSYARYALRRNWLKHLYSQPLSLLQDVVCAVRMSLASGGV